MTVKYFVSDYVVKAMDDFDKKTRYDATEWDRFASVILGLVKASHFKIISTKISPNPNRKVDFKIEIKTYDCKMVQDYTLYTPLTANWFEETVLSLEWCDQECNRKIVELIDKINEEENANV